MSDKDQSAGPILGALITGAALGAAAVVVSNQQMRDAITGKLSEAGKAVDKKYKETMDAVSKWGSDLESKSREQLVEELSRAQKQIRVLKRKVKTA